MASTYVLLNLTINPIDPGRDITLAELSELGFESFVETEIGLEAYIQLQDWDSSVLDQLYPLQEKGIDLSWSLTSISPKNWNAVWESDFEPIIIDNRCAVRADFHSPIDVTHDLVITPKMSFGTGHHETTYQMLTHILDYSPTNKKVLDMGCGTGVLAILAEKLGAFSVDAVDIEPWCVENSIENSLANSCRKINVFQGDSSFLLGRQYEYIIANINKNVLLTDMKIFSQCLSDNGQLFLSGFYTIDLEDIIAETTKCGLTYVSHTERNKWIAAQFRKND